MSDLFAVIVLYQITLEESLSFQTLKSSLALENSDLSLLVYDNSPTCANRSSLFEVDNMQIHYVSDVDNSGLSVAYNMAYKLAIRLKKKYLLLLDQDSIFPPDYFSVLSESVLKYNAEHLFVPHLVENGMLLSPCKFTFYKGRVWKNVHDGVISIADKSIFNSGICISLLAYNSIGGYNEAIPLDFSDHYFISEYKKKYLTFVLLPTIVKHSFSSFDSDKLKVLRRFKLYCRGTREYANSHKGFIVILFWNLLRSVKLAWRCRDLTFFSILYNDYILHEIDVK